MNRLYFYSNSHRIFFKCFFICLLAQVIFWFKTEKFHPPIQLFPQAPSETAIKAMSFGDKEYLFRILGVRMINSGDIFAGFAPLKNYDYQRIYDWMKIMDGLNNQSFSVPYIASAYYSNVDDKEKNFLLVKYLNEFAEENPQKKWIFFHFAGQIARYKVRDMKLSQSLAKKVSLVKGNNLPLIHRQSYAFISEEMGEGCIAFEEMKRIEDLVQKGELTASSKERAFIKYYLESRLLRLDNGKFNPKKCRNR